MPFVELAKAVNVEITAHVQDKVVAQKIFDLLLAIEAGFRAEQANVDRLRQQVEEQSAFNDAGFNDMMTWAVEHQESMRTELQAAQRAIYTQQNPFHFISEDHYEEIQVKLASYSIQKLTRETINEER